jgi:hypothetical protein
MLTDLSRSAGQNARRPEIDGILLHTGDREGRTVLVGTATNRYALAQAHEPASGELAVTLVTTAGVSRLLHALKPHCTKTRNTNVRLSRDAEHGGLWLGLDRTDIGADTFDPAGFPQLARLTTVEEAEGPYVLNPDTLAPFLTIANRRRARLRLSPGHQKTSVVIGDRYRGLVMHCRAEQQPPVVPWLDPADAITPAAARPHATKHEKAP